MADDLFLVVVFLAILPLSVRPFNAAVAAAALARVKRIDPLYSSFSLLAARCLTVRACYTNQPFCSVTATLDVMWVVPVLGQDGTIRVQRSGYVPEASFWFTE